MSRASDANLRVLLSELGMDTNRRQVIAGAFIIGIFELSFIGLAVAQALGEYRLGVSPVAVVTLVWIVWTWWHSWLFPRNRVRYLAHAHPYRTAFVRDIYPWVTLGFCQMWRPLFNGDTVDRLMQGPADFVRTLSPVAVVAGAALSVAALIVMISAIRSIGIANAAFVPEFRDTHRFVPVERGPYAHFMHPLFWSGILFSLALAIVISTPTAVAIAGVNVLYGLCYGPLESRRLGRIFGAPYMSYASRVAGLPVPAGLRRRSVRAPRTPGGRTTAAGR